MIINIKEYIESKKGEFLEDCQDAYRVNKDSLRFAVADGATREFFSGQFAIELVEKFCFDKSQLNRDILSSDRYEEWLVSTQDRWKEYLKNMIDNEEVTYLVENRYYENDSGASTFVGLELNRDNFTFKAMIIGDSCLFHIRDNKIKMCCLIDDYEEFDNSPDFFFSRAFVFDENNEATKREFIQPEIISRPFEEGDYFLLASDAMSRWLLMQQYKERWDDVWSSLLKEDRCWYKNFIEDIREDEDNRLEDDDITILIISTATSSDLIPLSKDLEECS